MTWVPHDLWGMSPGRGRKFSFSYLIDCNWSLLVTSSRNSRIMHNWCIIRTVMSLKLSWRQNKSEFVIERTERFEQYSYGSRSNSSTSVILLIINYNLFLRLNLSIITYKGNTVRPRNDTQAQVRILTGEEKISDVNLQFRSLSALMTEDLVSDLLR